MARTTGADSGNGPTDYLLGSRDEELARLESQHRVWAEDARRLWKRAGFSRGQTLVDLGCGPGFSTVDLARLVGPGGRVLGVDASPRFLAHLRAQAKGLGLSHVIPIESDVRKLDLEAATLDGAYARWLFCFVPGPEAVVARIASALRPGAALAVNDYFNYRAFTFAPPSAALDRVVRAVEICWRDRGGDLEIQGRMPGMMERQGLRVADVSTVSRIARPGSPLWNWPASFFRSFLPTLEEHGLITEGDRDLFWDDWRAHESDPAAFVFLPPLVDVIGIKR